MYAVIHGGVDSELRKKSCQILTNLDFDGFAIGGSLGKTKDQLVETVAATVPHLPPEAPNHLLGIGDIESISRCLPLGIDTFDSAYPTKAARHGVLFTQKGNLRIESRKHANDFEVIEADCLCPTCQHYSVAYLHHLFKAKEPSAASLASLHNVAFMIRWMKRLRADIIHGVL